MTDNTMETENSKQTKTRNSPMPDASFLMANGTQFLENLQKSNSAMLKTSFEITQVMMAFSQDCLQANFEGWKAFSACRNPSDLPAYQVEFAKKATAQYAKIASKLAYHLVSVVSRTAVPIREHILDSFVKVPQ